MYVKPLHAIRCVDCGKALLFTETPTTVDARCFLCQHSRCDVIELLYGGGIDSCNHNYPDKHNLYAADSIDDPNNQSQNATGLRELFLVNFRKLTKSLDKK